MADINLKMHKNQAEDMQKYRQSAQEIRRSDDEMMAFAELLFFAYRDFIGEPDCVLLEYGFGRAHHRVLHFVCRHPGMRVADLLDILNITKQSLARVLKQLVDDGFILQAEGENDRRERRLFLTEVGQNLATRLSDFQRNRILRALAATGPNGDEYVKNFLLNMVAEEDRGRVSKLISSHELPRDWNEHEDGSMT